MNCIIHKFLIQRECKRCSRPYFVSFSSSQIIFIIPGKRHVLLEINLPKDLQQSVLCYPHPTISRPSSDRWTSTQTLLKNFISLSAIINSSIIPRSLPLKLSNFPTKSVTLLPLRIFVYTEKLRGLSSPLLFE